MREPRTARVLLTLSAAMHILFLSEGDAESWHSWSGISKSIVDQLRAVGHTVTCGNVDLKGWDRWAAAASTVSFSRKRWGTRFHLSEFPFRFRSRMAGRYIAAQPEPPDLILQVGATFEPWGHGSTPYFLCCDSNIRMAGHGAATGYSDAVDLTEPELKAVAERELAVYLRAGAIFPLSERLRRSFIEDFGLPPHRVHAIHAGPNMDVAKIPEVRSEPANGRAPTILFVGRQFERKGGDVLVSAFRLVRERLPNARLVIMGPETLPVVEPGISFLGDLDKNDPAGWSALVDAYASADVFCLPTRFEPFGIAFIEAMFFGLPCIGTNAWAVPEMVVNGETGFTVPMNDVATLTDRLLRLLTDRELALRMGRAGRARAEREFTWLGVVERMMAVIEPVVAQCSASPR